ncbi:hypothetical protein [Rhizobium rhizogenes]|uniref:hypothetical protein n=1 Tax=Rhizobium rhizogenes TaxID=359 RepID=UPI001571B957|nr:hypothetical protein [Rhizobium rhizogenes]NTH22816.1 hypothetical protein [Rhizobium rhizogenes]NTH35846.1 hypothetical protein [Rhizobium rhizogenes]
MTVAVQSERVERDALGLMSIPLHAYYGPQTARGIANFPISGIRINQLPHLVKCRFAFKRKTRMQEIQ